MTGANRASRYRHMPFKNSAIETITLLGGINLNEFELIDKIINRTTTLLLLVVVKQFELRDVIALLNWAP